MGKSFQFAASNIVCVCVCWMMVSMGSRMLCSHVVRLSNGLMCVILQDVRLLCMCVVCVCETITVLFALLLHKYIHI